MSKVSDAIAASHEADRTDIAANQDHLARTTWLGETTLKVSFSAHPRVGNKKARNSFYTWGIQGGTMMLFLIIGTLAGVLLGLRFKVFVVIPFMLIIACAIIATGDGLKTIALTILATAVLVQIGYVLGLVVRVWAGRYLRRRKNPRYQPSKSKPVSF